MITSDTFYCSKFAIKMYIFITCSFSKFRKYFNCYLLLKTCLSIFLYIFNINLEILYDPPHPLSPFKLTCPQSKHYQGLWKYDRHTKATPFTPKHNARLFSLDPTPHPLSSEVQHHHGFWWTDRLTDLGIEAH